MREKTYETYEFIGKLAMALLPLQIKVKFSTLNELLSDYGEAPYNSPRAVAKGVSEAYDWWKKRQQHEVCYAIAQTYVDRNGNYAYKP